MAWLLLVSSLTRPSLLLLLEILFAVCKGVNSKGGSGTASVPQIGGEICLNPGALGI